jgi:hypothetical protein
MGQSDGDALIKRSDGAHETSTTISEAIKSVPQNPDERTDTRMKLGCDFECSVGQYPPLF